MLRFINQFQGMPVLSLRNGRKIAVLDEPIIDPDNLHVVAFFAQTRRVESEKVIFVEDLREMSPKGVIIDSEDNLMDLDGLVRLEKLLSINFKLLDKKVETDKNRSVGKVIDYTINDKSYAVQKMYVRPPIMKTITNSDLIIDRRQVVEVTDKKIIVRDTDIRLKSAAKKPMFGLLSS